MAYVSTFLHWSDTFIAVFAGEGGLTVASTNLPTVISESLHHGQKQRPVTYLNSKGSLSEYMFSQSILFALRWLSSDVHCQWIVTRI